MIIIKLNEKQMPYKTVREIHTYNCDSSENGDTFKMVGVKKKTLGSWE